MLISRLPILSFLWYPTLAGYCCSECKLEDYISVAGFTYRGSFEEDLEVRIKLTTGSKALEPDETFISPFLSGKKSKDGVIKFYTTNASEEAFHQFKVDLAEALGFFRDIQVSITRHQMVSIRFTYLNPFEEVPPFTEYIKLPDNTAECREDWYGMVEPYYMSGTKLLARSTCNQCKIS